MATPSGFFVAMGGENAQHLREDADASLRPFIGYMNQAIKVLEKKRIKCCWKPLHKGGWTLSPKTRIYEILPQTEICVQEPESGWADLFINEEDEASLIECGHSDDDFTIRWGKGSKRGELILTKDSVRKTEYGTWQMRFLGETPGDASITWQGYQFTWKRCISPFEADELIFSVRGNEIQAKPSGGDNRTFTLDTLLKGDDELNVNGVKTEFRIINMFDLEEFFQNYPEYPSRHGGWLIVGTEKPHLASCKCLDSTDALMKNLSISDIILDGVPLDEEEWRYDSSNKMLSSENENVQSPKGTIRYAPCLEWQFVHEESQSKDKWIQLVEDEDSNDDDTIEKSELEYFFDENVSIYRTEKRAAKEKYHILKSKPDDYQILLSPKKGDKPAFPESQHLYLKADIREMANQRSALRALESKPFPENLSLVELMQNRDRKRWEIFRQLSSPKYDWKVLTDPSFDGSEKQQQFVCTALATPDFAILDGPPGTGKTTTIRELILQLVLDGKRVLLAASTNAAINNVLERLRDEDKGKAPVYATRLGQKERAMNVEEFVFDTQIEEWTKQYGLSEDEARHLIIESANLVCGTTSGIHRLFNREYSNDSDPFDNLIRGGAPFDVMIIDECSKTTFQEFLVPARLAKKWVLVGDVRQLSPFTDRGQITSNLENIEGMNPALQTACALLQQLSPYKDKLIIPVDNAVMEVLQDEYEARVSGDRYDRNLPDGAMLIPSEEILKTRPDLLYQYNMLFITDTLFKKYADWMPKDAIVLKDDWMGTPHAFAHFSSKKWSHQHSYRHKGYKISEADKIHSLLMRDVKKSWSDELCWRLEREYWLRYLGGRRKSSIYKSQIDRLMPASRDVTGLVYSIRNIAFPSILESLSTNGMNLKKSINPTTLTTGFKNDELRCRLVTLTHQHRMDPQISEPPRELFYSEGSGKGRHARSLLDGGKVADRNWSYDAYPSRRVWIDCADGRVGEKNSNVKEAERIVREVKKFCEWAGNRSHEVAILTFYKGQEGLLREKLKELPDQRNKFSRFSYGNCSIRLATVDFFQGQEADIVFLSMVNTDRDGFLDTPNRLNVAITRARHQMVIVGKHSYFKNESRTMELNKLAEMYVRVD